MGSLETDNIPEGYLDPPTATGENQAELCAGGPLQRKSLSGDRAECAGGGAFKGRPEGTAPFSVSASLLGSPAFEASRFRPVAFGLEGF